MIYVSGRPQGRPPLKQGEKIVRSSVSMTKEQRIRFLKLGGSKWLRDQIEQQKDGHDEKRF